MEISQLKNSPINIFNFPKYEVISPSSPSLNPSRADNLTLSPQSKLALAYQWSDYSINAATVSFTYVNPEQSNSIQIKKAFSLHAQSESIQINLTISSANLGLAERNFPEGGISVQFLIKRSQFQYDHVAVQNYVKPIRQPQEILNDLVNGVQEAIKNNGDQPIFVLFDQEAIQSLLSNDKIAQAIQELLALLTMFHSQQHVNNFNPSTIYLSGKGKPYLQYTNTYNLDYSQQEIQFVITILPSSGQKDPLAHINDQEQGAFQNGN